MMNKQTKKDRHGKEVYLLGTNEEGRKVWLEKESWDCGWYWGMGYLEVYMNDASPGRARDIESHTHFVNFDISDSELYRLNEYHTLKVSTLNSVEMAHFKLLMGRAKELREESNEIHYTNQERYNDINKVLLPSLFEEMRRLLCVG